MSALRLVIFSIAALAIASAPALLAIETDAEYVGGTAVSIPERAAGALNLEDSKELRFQYGTAVYRLAYEQITGTGIAGAEDGGRRLFGRIPVPKLTPGGKKEILSIEFRDAAGESGTLNFELRRKQATEARATLALRTDKTHAAKADAEDWWGDRYWKTNRNRGNWPSERQPEPAPAVTAAAGTK